MKQISRNIRTQFELSVEEIDYLKVIMDRYCFTNKKDRISFTYSDTASTDTGNRTYEFALYDSSSGTEEQVYVPFTITIQQTDKHGCNEVLIKVNENIACIEKYKRQLPAIVDNILMHLQTIAVPPAPTVIPANAVLRHTISLFGKDFALISYMDGHSVQKENGKMSNITVKYISDPLPTDPEMRQTALKQLGFQIIAPLAPLSIAAFQIFGDFEGVDDSEAMLTIDLPDFPRYGLSDKNLSKYNTEECFNLLKQEKLFPIWQLSPDHSLNYINSAIITRYIIHEIQHNPKFTTSKLILV